MLKMTDIRKSYAVGPTQLDVLSGVNLSVTEGDMLAIMGKSGSGKSTLMNIIGLLEQPTFGEYLLNNKPVHDYSDDELSTTRNQLICFVFQSFFLLPRLTAVENVALPMRYRSARDDTFQRSMRMLEKVGIANRAEHLPSELSGGQRQRVAIARALVGDPGLILADEPTGALDAEVGSEIMNLFIDLNRLDGTTIVIITHDAGVAGRCDRMLTMQNGILT